MVLIKPRLVDFYNIAITQEEASFAIPFLDEDLPLYLDPFLLWKSPSQQDNSLHTAITNSFNHLGYLCNKGKEKDAIDILLRASECYEVGFGTSKTRIGKPIGKKTAKNVLALFKNIPQIGKSGFIHFEEIQLYVDNISKDRISDIACSFIKSFLIDYTIEQCEKYKIPLMKTRLKNAYNYRKNAFAEETTNLPQNPENKLPLIFAPKRWLKYLPWINFEDYFDNYFLKEIQGGGNKIPSRVELLNYNRQNYGVVQNYIKIKERTQKDCANDPLFKAIPIISAKRKLRSILQLPTGKENKADKKYEDNVSQLITSLVYPQLDFADVQSRTDSGVLIRDIIFYNNKSYDFLREIYEKYDCHQIVMEFKNTKDIDRTDINQLNRYLKKQFGRFGIIITRNLPPKAAYKNTIDLWSAQRRCIIILNDDDLKMMCQLYESKQRLPIDVIKKKYIEFTRSCPG